MTLEEIINRIDVQSSQLERLRDLCQYIELNGDLTAPSPFGTFYAYLGDVADRLDDLAAELSEHRRRTEREPAENGGTPIANETVTIDAKDFHNCHVQVDNISDAVEAIAKKLGVTV